MRELNHYLRLLVERDGSDLFFSAEAPILIKVEGRIGPVEEVALSAEQVQQLAFSILTLRQIEAFEQRPELNLGLGAEPHGRFRVNIFRQRGTVSMVVRYLRGDIPSIASLNLPPLLKDLVMEPRGLVLVVGGTGTGKSTTLASMIDHRNQLAAGHILTIEDPIEYIHRYKRSLVEQREVGVDTLTYADALKNAMREAPDVIMIGEIRDEQTMRHALAYAETGHLCFSTLHANNSNLALERIISFFPEAQHPQLLLDLSLNLRAIISMRLVPGVGGRRIPAVEIMLNTPHISDLIKQGRIDDIREAIERDEVTGSQTFDEALYTLYKAGRISLENALRHAESITNLRLRIHLEEAPLQGRDLRDLSIEE